MANEFDINIVSDVKSQFTPLNPGIHEVVFEGAEKGEVNRNGSQSATIDLHFRKQSGETTTQRIFEPKDNIRMETQYGANPSPLEQTMVTIKHVLDALNHDIYLQIENKTSDLKASSYSSLADKVVAYLNLNKGIKTSIKLVPFNQYANFPGFPAKISKNGNLYLNNRFIGDNLVLTPTEKTAIAAFNSAQPTDMPKQPQSKDDLLNGMSKDFASNQTQDATTYQTQDIDDLPF